MGQLDTDRAARRRQIQLTQDLIAPRASAARGSRRRVPSRPEETEQPLELILARNLVSIVSLAALLVDAEGRIVFYNEAAAGIVGSPFEEIGTLTREAWNARYGPFGSNGTPLVADELPLTVAVREGRPAFARLRVRGDRGLLDVEAGALPCRDARRSGTAKHIVRAGGRTRRSQLVLDAGTGLRELGIEMAGRCRRLDLLLTHLHLDHIQGLMFFAPFFDPDVEVTIWGPPAAGRALRKRLARYISDPLSPIEIGELPARASLVAHRGTTLGYRLSENETSLCYLPDHEPALGRDLASSRTAWISGHALARGASLLMHDGQYTEREHPAHRGWGHSSLPDAPSFARRCEARRVLLVHHDPAHDDDFLDAHGQDALDCWAQLGSPGRAELGREGDVVDLSK
jgi:phosphoribosyl 1,2-cyclic phosphodiesterase